MREVLAIIPARRGSKGIPQKNIKLFNGHPLIAWTINSAKRSNLIDEIICTTDDPKIAAIANSYGAQTPFLRPTNIAGDFSTDYEFIKHTLDSINYKPELIILLRPTTPLRRIGLIDDAIKYFHQFPEADSLRSVVTLNKTPYKMWSTELREGKYLSPLSLPQINHEQPPYDLPRQLLPSYYLQAGAIDIIKYETIMKEQNVSGNNIIPFQIQPSEFIDIDTDSDFQDAIKKIDSSIFDVLS